MNVNPAFLYGRRPVYAAKIGTMPGSFILAKRVKMNDYNPGDKITFVDQRAYAECKYVNWSTGIIDNIEDNRLFISLF